MWGVRIPTCALPPGQRCTEARPSRPTTTTAKGSWRRSRVAAKSLGLSVGELVSRSTAMVNGTTIVTNAITEVRGARVGVLVNAGFPDTFRLVAGARRNIYDDHAQVDPPEIVPKDCVEEIEERVGRDGSVLVPMDEAAVRQAVRNLKAKGVATIAVCFLWSFKHPAHELRAREIIHAEWPEVFVTLSSEIHPVIREYERFLTAVFNCFCQPAAVRLLDTLGQRLESHGFRGNFTFFSGAGGAISAELAKRFPILLLASGPAGGVIGATQIAELLGESNVMTGDMGGTSFDASLVEGARPAVAASVKIDEFDTGISLIDVISVGAGWWQYRLDRRPRRPAGRTEECGVVARPSLLRSRWDRADRH
jgi:N-methylhydantoinase A